MITQALDHFIKQIDDSKHFLYSTHHLYYALLSKRLKTVSSMQLQNNQSTNKNNMNKCKIITKQY